MTEVAAWFTLPELRAARLVCRQFLRLKPTWTNVFFYTRSLLPQDLEFLSGYINLNLASTLHIQRCFAPLQLLPFCSHLQDLTMDCPRRSKRTEWYTALNAISTQLASLTLRMHLEGPATRTTFPKPFPIFANLQSFSFDSWQEVSLKEMNTCKKRARPGTVHRTRCVCKLVCQVLFASRCCFAKVLRIEIPLCARARRAFLQTKRRRQR